MTYDINISMSWHPYLQLRELGVKVRGSNLNNYLTRLEDLDHTILQLLLSSVECLFCEL